MPDTAAADAQIARILADVILRVATMLVGAYMLRTGLRAMSPASPHQAFVGRVGAIVGILLMIGGAVMISYSALKPSP